jgi:SAM-dependent methyltransferase
MTPKSNKHFWNSEYSKTKNFSLSVEPAEDLLKFTRWLMRGYGKEFLNPTINVLDLGCGNGRNLIYLGQEFGCRGVGYDISEVAIKQAKENAQKLPLKFFGRSISGKINSPDSTFDIVLDMMTSHYLDISERTDLISEIARVLKPNGWFMYKTFLLEGDINANRMIRENPANEKNSYLHPTIGLVEHVSTEDEIVSAYEPYFNIEKIEKTGKHIIHGKAGKRRSVIVYMRKK